MLAARRAGWSCGDRRRRQWQAVLRPQFPTSAMVPGVDPATAADGHPYEHPSAHRAVFLLLVALAGLRPRRRRCTGRWCQSPHRADYASAAGGQRTPFHTSLPFHGAGSLAATSLADAMQLTSRACTRAPINVYCPCSATDRASKVARCRPCGQILQSPPPSSERDHPCPPTSAPSIDTNSST